MASRLKPWPRPETPMVGSFPDCCARGERPCRGAAEKRDELAPFQPMELHSMPAGQDHHTDYRISRDQSAGMAGIIQPITGPKVGFGSTATIISVRALSLLHPNQQTFSSRSVRPRSATT